MEMTGKAGKTDKETGCGIDILFHLGYHVSISTQKSIPIAGVAHKRIERIVIAC